MGKTKIGKRIRKVRIHQGRTLQEIADQCNLSRSMVSKIETSSVIPSVATLMKIAEALGVKISSLLEDDGGFTAILDKKEDVLNGFIPTDKGYSIFPVAVDFNDKLIQPFFYRVYKDELKQDFVSHKGEEYVYLIEGEIKIQVGDIVYHLRQGDSLYFNALEVHSFSAVTDMAMYINIFIDN